MAHPTSIRLDSGTRQRLQDRADREQVSATSVATRLIDEGLRMADHPGVVFRPGPSGRRATLTSGPDVAEVVSVIQHLEQSGDEAVSEAARWFELPQSTVRAAIDYYAAFTVEIEGEIARRRGAAELAHQQSSRREQLLS